MKRWITVLVLSLTVLQPVMATAADSIRITSSKYGPMASLKAAGKSACLLPSLRNTRTGEALKPEEYRTYSQSTLTLPADAVADKAETLKLLQEEYKIFGPAPPGPYTKQAQVSQIPAKGCGAYQEANQRAKETIDGLNQKTKELQAQIVGLLSAVSELQSKNAELKDGILKDNDNPLKAQLDQALADKKAAEKALVDKTLADKHQVSIWWLLLIPVILLGSIAALLLGRRTLGTLPPPPSSTRTITPEPEPVAPHENPGQVDPGNLEHERIVARGDLDKTVVGQPVEAPVAAAPVAPPVIEDAVPPVERDAAGNLK